MSRSLLLLLAGALGGALLTSIISVYLLHDVDHGQTGRLNAAFAGLCTESVIFALALTAATAALTAIGRGVFRWQGHTPGQRTALLTGFGVAALQYPLEYFVRSVSPKSNETFLYFYLLGAPLLCTVFLLVDIFRQKKRSDAAHALTPL